VRSVIHLDSPTFDLLVEIVSDAKDVIVRAAGLSLPGYEPTLSAAQQAEVDRFLSRIRSAPYSPPTDNLPVAPLLAYLSERGDIEDTGAGVVFAAEAFREMTERVRAHIEANGAISMAEVRDMFGNSRKYAQAFLEHLDALHITRRSGDLRTLR